MRGLAGNHWVWLLIAAALAASAGWWTNEAEPASFESALRWGYDPWHPTGLEDAAPVSRPLPPGYRVERVATGLDRPTQLDGLPDGRILITEQAGAVRVVQDGRLLDEPFVELDVHLPDLNTLVEMGLTGIAVDPEFDAFPFVFLYYTDDEPGRTVIVRVPVEDGRAGAPEEIFSWNAEPVCCHVGGGMAFGPDSTLYVGMGDHDDPIGAQFPLNPPGSILRIDRDGTDPEGPIFGAVYAYGLRNPFDVAVDAVTGRVFAGENGFFGQDALIEVRAGANYGWPGVELQVSQEEIEPPLLFYHSSLGIAGVEVYRGTALPALDGALFFCQFNGGQIHQISFSPDGPVEADVVLDIDERCTSDIATGPDGPVYFLDYVEGALYRIVAE